MGWGWAGRSLAGIVGHRWRICPKSGGLAVTMELAGQWGCLSILQGRSRTLWQDTPPPKKKRFTLSRRKEVPGERRAAQEPCWVISLRKRASSVL